MVGFGTILVVSMLFLLSHGRQITVPVVQKPSSVLERKPSTVKQLAPVLCASFCVAAIMYPLDLIRALQMANAGSKETTLQLLSNFRKTHGIKGFFTQGLVPELARATWMRTIKFGLFPIVHLRVAGIPEAKGSGYSKTIAAILTSIPEAISIMPLEIAKISLQLDSKKVFDNSMIAAMKSVLNDRGPMGFMIGYFGVQYRQASWGAGYFASIAFFERQINRLFQILKIDTETSVTAKSVSQLTSGFCAGVFGAMLNTPADTIRSNVQKRLLGGLPGQTSFFAVIILILIFYKLAFSKVGREIISAKGAGALYAGFSSKAVHLGGGGALMAFFIPFFKNVFAKLD